MTVATNIFAVESSLNKGQHLLPGESIISKNGKYCAVFQKEDGNLIIFATAEDFQVADYKEIPKTIIWHLNLQIKSPFTLQINYDGVLVIYKQKNDEYPVPVWSHQTQGHDNDIVELRMQDDGNLVLYKNNQSIWNTQTYFYTNFFNINNLIRSKVVVYVLQSNLNHQKNLGKLTNNYLVHEGLRFISFDRALEAHFAPGGLDICQKEGRAPYVRVKKAGLLDLHVDDCEKWCRDWAQHRTYPVDGVCWSLVRSFKTAHGL